VISGADPRPEMAAQGADPRSRMTSSVVIGELYISLDRCSMSQGLEHCRAGVIVSRQMNPKLG